MSVLLSWKRRTDQRRCTSSPSELFPPLWRRASSLTPRARRRRARAGATQLLPFQRHHFDRRGFTCTFFSSVRPCAPLPHRLYRISAICLCKAPATRSVLVGSSDPLLSTSYLPTYLPACLPAYLPTYLPTASLCGLPPANKSNIYIYIYIYIYGIYFQMKLVASQPRQSTVHNKTGWCPHQNASSMFNNQDRPQSTKYDFRYDSGVSSPFPRSPTALLFLNSSWLNEPHRSHP